MRVVFWLLQNVLTPILICTAFVFLNDPMKSKGRDAFRRKRRNSARERLDTLEFRLSMAELMRHDAAFATLTMWSLLAGALRSILIVSMLAVCTTTTFDYVVAHRIYKQPFSLGSALLHNAELDLWSLPLPLLLAVIELKNFASRAQWLEVTTAELQPKIAKLEQQLDDASCADERLGNA